MGNILNTISFSNSAALLGLATIPLVILILKLFPPMPKKFYFSSLFLIKKIDHESTKKYKTPLWLLIYRIIFFILIVLFFSKPYINYQKDYADHK